MGYFACSSRYFEGIRRRFFRGEGFSHVECTASRVFFSYIRRFVGGCCASGLEKERCWELLPGGVAEGGNRAPDQGRAPTHHLPGRGGEGESKSLKRIRL